MAKWEEQKTKRDFALRKTDFLTMEAGRSFHKLVETFTSLFFLVYFDEKQQLKLMTEASGYSVSENWTQKQDSK